MQAKLVGVDRDSQIFFQSMPDFGPRFHVRLEKTVGRASGVLGTIKGDVRLLQQIIHTVAVVRREDDPDTHPDHDVMAFDIERHGKRLDQLLRKLGGLTLIRQPVSTMANSSPPNRATVSWGDMVRRRRWAT